MNALLKKMPPAPVAKAAGDRVAALDWAKLTEQLDGFGNAVIEGLLTPDECRAVSSRYPDDRQFRSHVHMARHGFGKGEYKYFRYPLPDLISGLRTALYPRLAAIANAWNERMGIDQGYPAKHPEFLKLCHDAGQTRPTPLLLQYVPGDFNCLHQDLYGDPVVRARQGLYRRRVRTDRAAAAHAEQGGGRAVEAGRCRRVCRPQSSGPRHQGHIPGQPAPWRQPAKVRQAAHLGNHIP
jgi:hypothetical protein